MAGEYADSFLTRALEDARLHVDEPTTRAKYTDAILIRRIEDAYAVILSEINRNSQTPVVARVTITIVSGVTEYVLPCTVGSIVAIYEESDSGLRIFYNSRSTYNPSGKLVWIEGSILRLQSDSVLSGDAEIIVEYIPSGTARLHNGTCALNTTGSVATFGATPNAGALDTHINAYAGSIFRILKASGTGDFLQERTITSYDNETREATLDMVLDPIPTGTIYYEIAPAIHKGLDSVIGLYVAYIIAGIEGNIKRAGGILAIYRDQLRHLRLTAYYSNLQDASTIHGDDFANRRYRRI